MQPLALSCGEPAFRFVCDFYKEQHHRHFGQHANRCGKCGRRGCSEQGNGYCNRQFKEVGCADHSGRCCNAVRQLEQPTGTISNAENQEGLQNQWHGNQHDMQGIIQNDLPLKGEDQYQRQQKSNRRNAVKFLDKGILKILFSLFLGHKIPVQHTT